MGDAKLILSSTSGTGSSLTYLTKSDQAAVFAKYLEKIVELGWKKEMELNSGEGKMLNISKGSASAVITIGENSTDDTSFKTTVSIIYTSDTDK